MADLPSSPFKYEACRMRAGFSILVATYNGSRFLSDQLESLAHQTLPPETVLISDDGSRDDTLTIARDWAGRVSFPVEILTGNPRQGVVGNFDFLLHRAQSEFLMLCDQDDVWLPAKLETVATFLTENPAALCVVNDLYLCDGELQIAGTKYERHRQAGGGEGLVTGCAMTLRRPFLSVVLPIPDTTRNHDNWIATLAQGLGVYRFLPEPLQMYRRHGGNLSHAASSELAGIGRWRTLRRRYRRIGQDVSPAWQEQRDFLSQVLLRVEARSEELAALGLSKQAADFSNRLRRQIAVLSERIRIARLPRRRRGYAIAKALGDGLYAGRANMLTALNDLVRRRAR